jgi:hypothetical protein
MTLVCPVAGPVGLCCAVVVKVVWNQSEHHSHTLPVME